MLYIVGLGLGDEKDITLRGLEAVKKCHKVYIEAYTSLLSFGTSSDGISRLEKLYGKAVIVADREMVEERADIILSEALESNVAFLVVGDPFGATTHTDLVVRAKKLGVEVQVIHNASVMNAIGICGLQLYRFGETVSIPFFTETWRPDSFYEKIHRNQQLGLHTLCLLEVGVYLSYPLHYGCQIKKSLFNGKQIQFRGSIVHHHNSKPTMIISNNGFHMGMQLFIQTDILKQNNHNSRSGCGWPMEAFMDI